MERSAISLNDSLLSGVSRASVSNDSLRKPYHAGLTYSRTAAWVALCTSVVVGLGTVFAGLELIDDTYAVSFDNRLDGAAVFGTILFFMGLCVTPLLLGVTAFIIAQHRILTRKHRVIMLAALSLLCLCIVVLAFEYLIQAAITFRETPHPDNFLQFLGGFLVVLFAALGFAFAFMAHRAGVEPTRGHNPAAASRPILRTIQPYGWRYTRNAALLLFSLFGFCWFLTSFMTPVWNYSATSYFGATSTYSLVQTYWTININYNDTATNPANVWNPPIIYVKLYEDVCVYFSVVLGITMLCILGARFPRVQRCIHFRVPTCLTRKHPAPAFSFDIFPTGLTLGELLVLLSFCGLFGYWIRYWGVDYQRIQLEASLMADSHAEFQIAARVLGHLTTLCMSFLVFPVARNSVWESILGIPFDRAIKYHRALGYLVWMLVTLHMLVWQLKWAMEGVLWNNVVTIDNLIIAGTPTNMTIALAGDYLHDDNFTIPIAELAWVILTVAVLVAVTARRKNYALFQYTHHAVWFFFFAALLHAWTHWYYMIGGLTLYLLDKLTRLVKSSRQVTLLRMSHAAGITRLEVSADFMLNSDRYYAGQYAFVNIPSIALLQWHPFTISSAPQSADGLHGERVLTFHIKEQRGWTKDLARLAMSNPRASDIVMSIDGPYGRAGHYFEKQCLVMVAGGIGITPFHSIASDLFTRASQPDVYGPPGSLKHVHLVWVVRDAALLQLFADTFADILRNNPYGMFHLHLFCTNSARPVTNKALVVANGESGVRLLSQDGVSLLGTSDVLPAEVGMCNPANALLLNTKVTYGRPNLETIFAAVTRDTANPSQSTVTAMVCGPEPLVHQVSHLAFQHNFDFHSEVFHF